MIPRVVLCQEVIYVLATVIETGALRCIERKTGCQVGVWINTTAQNTANGKRLLIGGTCLEISLKKKLRSSPETSRILPSSAWDWEINARERDRKRVPLIFPKLPFIS
jgi:hypothetical protein